MIYLDHNATTRPLPEVIAAMNVCMADDWANPSSRHAAGQAARVQIGYHEAAELPVYLVEFATAKPCVVGVLETEIAPV